MIGRRTAALFGTAFKRDDAANLPPRRITYYMDDPLWVYFIMWDTDGYIKQTHVQFLPPHTIFFATYQRL